MEYKFDIIYSDDYKENKDAMVKEFEIKFISKYLQLYKGNVAATARKINYHPVSLRKKLYKLGINPDSFKNKNSII